MSGAGRGSRSGFPEKQSLLSLTWEVTQGAGVGPGAHGTGNQGRLRQRHGTEPPGVPAARFCQGFLGPAQSVVRAACLEEVAPGRFLCLSCPR